MLSSHRDCYRCGNPMTILCEGRYRCALHHCEYIQLRKRIDTDDQMGRDAAEADFVRVGDRYVDRLDAEEARHG